MEPVDIEEYLIPHTPLEYRDVISELCTVMRRLKIHVRDGVEDVQVVEALEVLEVVEDRLLICRASCWESCYSGAPLHWRWATPRMGRWTPHSPPDPWALSVSLTR